MRKIAIVGAAGSGKDTVAKMILELRRQGGVESLAFAAPLKDFCYDVFRFTNEQLWGSSDARNKVDRRYSDERRGMVGSLARWWRDATYELNRQLASDHFDMWADQWLDEVLPRFADKVAARDRLTAWFKDGIAQEHITPRYLLQTLGTEFGRSVSADIWIDYTLKRVAALEDYGYDTVVITDCRFINEARKLHNDGFEIWRIVRPDVQAVAGGVVNHISESEQMSSAMASYVTSIIVNAGTLFDLQESVRTLLDLCT